MIYPSTRPVAVNKYLSEDFTENERKKTEFQTAEMAHFIRRSQSGAAAEHPARPPEELAGQPSAANWGPILVEPVSIVCDRAVYSPEFSRRPRPNGLWSLLITSSGPPGPREIT